MKIRYDKDWHECMNLKELLHSIENSKSNKPASKKRIPEGEPLELKALPKKRIKTKELSVLPHLKATVELDEVSMVSNIFRGFEFYISNFPTIEIKKKLETMILQNAGNFVQNYLVTNTHIIACRMDFKLKTLLKQFDRNIIFPVWIFDCIEKNQLLDLSPKYLLHSSEYQKVQLFHFSLKLIFL